MKIALDAMGGDFGPSHLVPGAVMALKEYPHITEGAGEFSAKVKDISEFLASVPFECIPWAEYSIG